jgi:hypothetical protein
MPKWHWTITRAQLLSKRMQSLAKNVLDSCNAKHANGLTLKTETKHFYAARKWLVSKLSVKIYPMKDCRQKRRLLEYIFHGNVGERRH